MQVEEEIQKGLKNCYPNVKGSFQNKKASTSSNTKIVNEVNAVEASRTGAHTRSLFQLVWSIGKT